MTGFYGRRQLLVGGGALLTAGAAWAAEPRRTRTDFSRTPLDSLVPLTAGGWSGIQDPDVVPEKVDGSEDHGQTVTRRYYGRDLAPVMLVVSYHGPWSPDLKVHRPETCYAVAGFGGAKPRAVTTDLGSVGKAPSIAFSARREDRLETVLYWTRVGDRFPQDLTMQRLDFLLEAARGFRADGLLFRASLVDLAPDPALATLQAFARALMASASPNGRRLFLGSRGTLAA